MFSEAVVREAVLNGLSHRDYRDGGSIFVRPLPRSLEIVSPGGFPPGITAENLLWQQAPRNRWVAKVMARCGLVERSGQGANVMFETSVRERKALPDYSRSDPYHVNVVPSGEVQDEQFLRFLERVGQETLAGFTTEDFLLLDAIHREIAIPESLRDKVPRLRELGVIEAKGRGRGTRYLLSERFYRFTGKRGAYTRRRGLDTETNKALLLEHIKRNQAEGSPLRDLQEVLPAKSRKQIQYLLRVMRKGGLVHACGKNRAALWYPGLPSQQDGGQ